MFPTASAHNRYLIWLLKWYSFCLQDAKITKDEWLKMWGDCLKDIEQGHFPSWQKKYMDLMFDVNDKSGTIYIDEYTLGFFTIASDVSI